MRVIGLIGGTGWPATRDYYELINRLVQQRLGRLHGADLRLWSFDFQSLLDVADQPGALNERFASAAIALKSAGAQLLAVASNTGHLYLEGVHATQLPIVHIAKACARALAKHSAEGNERNERIERVGILATRRACEGGVFNASLQSAGITPCYLDTPLAELLDKAIFSELETGQSCPLTQEALLSAATLFNRQGISHVLLGCTELRLSLLPPALANNSAGARQPLRFWDSTEIHCGAIVDAALLPPDSTASRATHAPPP